MNKQLILKKCQEVIDKHNENTTLYELLETINADGLTLYEAELVCHALDNYMSGATYYFRSGEFNDKEFEPNQFSRITPFDIVAELESMNKIPTNDTLYEQVCSIERWGYDMGSDSNAQYFDPLWDKIIKGYPREVIIEMSTWSKSNIYNIPYKQIHDTERIVFDDMTYLLTANRNMIVLYKKI